MTGRQHPDQAFSRRREKGHLGALLGPLVGRRIPGGCLHCDSYQAVRRVPGRRVWVLDVHHGQGCRWYRRHVERSGRAAP